MPRKTITMPNTLQVSVLGYSSGTRESIIVTPPSMNAFINDALTKITLKYIIGISNNMMPDSKPR
jgi:hypothetical protein